MILDAGADKAKLRGVLTKLHNRMEELQKRAFMYKSYQKNFKVGSAWLNPPTQQSQLISNIVVVPGYCIGYFHAV